MALIRQTNKVQALAADIFLRDFLPELQRRREYADIRERAITGYDRQLVERTRSLLPLRVFCREGISRSPSLSSE